MEKKKVVMDAAPLPSGWEARNTDDGRTFFIDHNSGRPVAWMQCNSEPQLTSGVASASGAPGHQ